VAKLALIYDELRPAISRCVTATVLPGSIISSSMIAAGPPCGRISLATPACHPIPIPGADHLTRRLDDGYDNFLRTAPTNSYAVVDDQGWHLSADSGEKLDQEAQDRLTNLKSWLAQNMRRVKLPELLIEVHNELSYTRLA
jgi:hypothetical protein